MVENLNCHLPVSAGMHECCMEDPEFLYILVVLDLGVKEILCLYSLQD